MNTIDWTLSNLEIARITGSSPVDIAAARRVLGVEKVTKHYPACKSWDWSKPDIELSRILGVGVTTIRTWRFRLGKPWVTPPGRDLIVKYPSPVIPKTDFSKVDWENTNDRTIANQVGITREYVRQKRAQLGKPKCYKYELQYREFVKRFGHLKDVGITYRDARKVFPTLCNSTFGFYCGRSGIKRLRGEKPCIYPWHLLNFDLPNNLLGAIWSISISQIAVWRSRSTLQRPTFRYYGGVYDPAFENIVEAEREKARKYAEESEVK